MKDIAVYFTLFKIFSPNLALAVMWAAKTISILLLSWSVSALLRDHSARARCWIWRLTFLGLALLLALRISPPVIRSLSPGIETPITQEALKTFWETAEAYRQTRSYEDQKNLVAQRRKEAIDDRKVTSPPWSQDTPLNIEPRLEDARGPTWSLIETHLHQIWFIGSLLTLLFVTVRSLLGLQWLRRRSTPADGFLLQEANAACLQLRVTRPPRVHLSEKLNTPLLSGFIQPSIYLPKEANDWSSQKISDVLYHELSHWKRGDYAWLQIGRLMLTLFWWNPFLRIALRKMSEEAEEATDDMVILKQEDPAGYAKTLVEIATGVSNSNTLTGIPMIGYRTLEKRIRGVMSNNRWRGRLGIRGILTIAATALFVAFISTIDTRANSNGKEEAKSQPLTQKQRTLIRRLIANQEKRLTALRFTHVKMSSVLTLRDPDGSIKTQPTPSKIEIWWDLWTGIFRAEYRPGADPWFDGSRPFSITNHTRISDGKETYYFAGNRTSDDEIPSSESRGLMDDYLGSSEAMQLTKTLNILLKVDSLKFNVVTFSFEKTTWRGKEAIKIKEAFDQDGTTYQQTTYVIVPEENDLIRLTERENSRGVTSRSVVEGVKKTSSGSFYPTHFSKKTLIGGDKELTTTYAVSEFKLLSSLPIAISDFPKPNVQTYKPLD